MKSLLFILLAQLLFSVSIASELPAEDQYDNDDDTLPYVEIKYVADFSQLAKKARAENKIILLEVSADDCGYCELLEEEFIKPMLRSGDYTDVLIRKINMDSFHTIKNFSGDKTNPVEFTSRLKINFTPTLLFFDGHGNEVSQRILGINSLDLYGGYLDQAITTGLHKIKSQ
jgi:thioredoxin-related protein